MKPPCCLDGCIQAYNQEQVTTPPTEPSPKPLEMELSPQAHSFQASFGLSMLCRSFPEALSQYLCCCPCCSLLNWGQAIGHSWVAWRNQCYTGCHDWADVQLGEGELRPETAYHTVSKGAEKASDPGGWTPPALMAAFGWAGERAVPLPQRLWCVSF